MEIGFSIVAGFFHDAEINFRVVAMDFHGVEIYFHGWALWMLVGLFFVFLCCALRGGL